MDDIEAHFDDYSGHQFEANVEPNIEPNYDHVGDHENVVESIQRQTEGKHVQGDHPRGSASDMPGTSVVPKNLKLSTFDNPLTWVIPRSKAYSFGQVNNTMRSREPNTMIYKSQFFHTKKKVI